MAPNSENSKTILETTRDTVHEAVKTDKIEQQEREAAKSSLTKAKDSIVGKVGNLVGSSEPEKPEGPPRDDNVVIDAAKILHHDIGNQAEKAAEKIYKATEPPAPKK